MVGIWLNSVMLKWMQNMHINPYAYLCVSIISIEAGRRDRTGMNRWTAFAGQQMFKQNVASPTDAWILGQGSLSTRGWIRPTPKLNKLKHRGIHSCKSQPQPRHETGRKHAAIGCPMVSGHPIPWHSTGISPTKKPVEKSRKATRPMCFRASPVEATMRPRSPPRMRVLARRLGAVSSPIQRQKET